MSEIAKENSVSGDTIRRAMISNGIDYWTTQYREKLSEEEIDVIQDLYCNGKLSANQVAILIGTTHNTVLRVLQNRGIKTRSISESQFNYANKEISDLYNDADWLSQRYNDDGMTTGEIAASIGVHETTLFRHMKKLGIKTKSISEAKRGQLVGDKHPNWKGGITPLKHLLREYFTVNQVPKIAKRDNYTCQLCGATHTVLNVHHIKPFSEIVEEIVSEHKELDPNNPNDRNSLYNIIVNDSRFLDEDNLITYCRDCHYFKIHKYQHRKTISSQAS